MNTSINDLINDPWVAPFVLLLAVAHIHLFIAFAVFILSNFSKIPTSPFWKEKGYGQYKKFYDSTDMSGKPNLIKRWTGKAAIAWGFSLLLLGVAMGSRAFVLSF